MSYDPVTVSTGALASLLRAHGAEPHITLAEAAVWETPSNHRIVEQAAVAELVEHGLGSVNRPGPDLMRAVAVLSRLTDEYYGWFTYHGKTTAVLAVASGLDALLALRRGRRVTLATIEGSGLAEAIVGCLPSARPAPGPAINVLRDVAGGQDRTVFISDTKPGDRVAAALSRLSCRPAIGAGEFHVAARCRPGDRRRMVRYPICYHDTPEGRWWLEVVPGHNDEWVVAAPATPGLLVDRLHEAHWTVTH